MPETKSRPAIEWDFLARSLQLTLGLVVAVLLAREPMLASSAPLPPEGGVTTTDQAPIEFWNREIAVMRVPLIGATPQDRAARAVERLQELPLSARAHDIAQLPLTLEGHDGIAFAYGGRVLFFLGKDDLDLESGDTLPQASERVLRNLDEALDAREAERRWPVIRAGLFFTLLGLFVGIAAGILIWKFYGWLARRLHIKEGSLAGRWIFFGLDVLPHIVRAAESLLGAAAWVLTLVVVYFWLTLSLRRFPYTQPWGNRLGVYVLALVQQFGQAAVHALPGLLAVLIMFTVARWIARIGRAFFDQVTNGKIRVSWMDPDVAQATQRIFSALVWIFALVLAYPYIPGSGTQAFKGLSVFFGLVISLGSTGIINQVMSGLFVAYSKALKRGEWVRVNEIEGEVLEVGLLAAKVRTIEGQEVTIPNSVVVGTSTRNYTRLGYPDGMIASTTLTIGYDAPWRQVHALLILAAGRTTNIRKQPEPYVIQRQLSDFYVEYMLVVRLEDEKERINTLSSLHAGIQDAFNEYDVQIMSPHFVIQPKHSVGVPPSEWHRAPGTPAADPANRVATKADPI